MSNKVLVEQVKLVDTLLDDQISSREEIESIETEILELKKSINMLKPKIKSIQASDTFGKSTEQIRKENQMISKFKAKVGKLQQSLEDLKLAKLKSAARQDAIEKWKLKAKAHIYKDEEDKIDNDELCLSDLDNSVLEAFLKNTLYKIEDFSSKKKLEEMLYLYVDRVTRRENSIQKYYNESIRVKDETDYTKDRIRELETEITMNNDYYQFKNQLKEVNSREKAIEMLMEERRSQLEYEILKQADDNFDLYLETNSEVFKNVKKTYGSKISEKMKAEQKQEFVDMIREQYEKRYTEIKTTHYQILDVDKELDQVDQQINQALPERIQKAQQDKADNETKIQSLFKNQEALATAEKQ